METLIILILSGLIITMGFIIRNLILKQEKAEDIIMSFQKYMIDIDEIIKQSDKTLKEIDARGTFKSDDEIGWFFEKVKLIQDILNQFKLKDNA